jgi:hypothetical protein
MQVDSAVAYYEAAYQKNSNDAKAIVYSSLAKLAQISVDPKVAALFKNHFGFEQYPATLNALLSPDWLKNYPDVEYYYYDYNSGREVEWLDEWYVESDGFDGVDRVGYYYWGSTGYTFVSSTPRLRENLLPGLLTPNWVKGDKNSVYGQSLIDGAASVNTWPVLLMANLIDKNSSGLNSLLDDLISAVFGDQGSFKQACDRIARLKASGETVKISEFFVGAMELEGVVFNGDAEIGWAELNLVVSYMLAVKASLEYVAAYDWNTNLNVLKDSWKPTDEYVLERFKTLDVNGMPFKGSLMNARSGKMAAAKRDYIAAIDGFDESYKVIRDRDWVPLELAVAWPVAHDGITKLKSAIENGVVFWIPDLNNLTVSNLDWPSGNGPDVIGGLDMGKFFQEGYFSLPNLFETEGSKAPAFYTMSGQKLTVGNYKDLLEDALEKRNGCYYDYDDYCDYEDTYIGFKFKTSTITNLVKVGQSANAGGGLPSGDQILPMFDPVLAWLLFAKYNNEPLPKTLTKESAGGRLALLEVR